MIPEIRTLTLEDVEQFVALRRQALKTDPAAFPWKPDEDPSSKVKVVRERLLTAKPADGPIIVGAFDPDLAGIFGLIRESDVAVRLWGLYVQPPSRRKGIGRLLLREIIHQARSLPGVKQVILSVAKTGEPAIQLYTSEGFRKSSEDQGSLHMVLDVG